MSERAKEVAEYAQRLHARGGVANHDGNVSVRDGQGRYLVTPTATSKRRCAPTGWVVVDDAGKQVGGRGKPFSEIGLHLTVFQNRSDANAVIHAHPPNATGFAVAGVPLDEAFLAEAVVSLGAGVPTVAVRRAGRRRLPRARRLHRGPRRGATRRPRRAQLGPRSRDRLSAHGARRAPGEDRAVARQLGGVRPLPSAVLPKLLEARAKAGLGGAPAAAGKKVVVACAPAPPGSDVEVYDPKRPRAAVLPSPTALADIIRQEIAAALKK